MPLLDTPHHRLDAPIHEPDWQARVMATYQQGLDRERDALRTELVARLGVLIEEAVAPERVFVDMPERTATVGIDDIRFRGRQGSVTLVRPCVYCSGGYPDSVVERRFRDHYSTQQSEDILTYLRYAQFGSLNGATNDAFVQRLRGKPAADSKLVTEVVVFALTGPVMLPKLALIERRRMTEYGGCYTGSDGQVPNAWRVPDWIGHPNAPVGPHHSQHPPLPSGLDSMPDG